MKGLTMKTHTILTRIIDNLRNDHFADAQFDCTLLPACNEKNKLYATIGAIDSQPTEKAFFWTKSIAISLADRLIGRI